MKVGKNLRGFTIVELLIVIVVIGILAALTIVGYNGVSNRAKESAAKSVVSQATKKLLVYASLNSDQFPDTLADADVPASSGVVFQYSYDNSTSPKKYCVTATSNGVSYYQNNTTQQAPATGACPGHGLNGATAITNFFQNPNFSGADAPMNQSQTSPSLGTCVGSPGAIATVTSSAAASIRLQPNEKRLPVTPGQTFYASGSVTNTTSGARNFNMSIRFYDTAGASLGAQTGTIADSSTVIINPGATQVFNMGPAVAPGSALSVGVNANRNAGSNAVSGDTFCVDNVILSTTPANYADGDSSGWVWNGTPNASTSTGSPL